ncbi:uncharacterized protein LOC108481531 [Gossypium arboreum]|uniref:uncharacterized protein LOC108481531 n=1 Tax=Gossypium arboreum TaxID=29729 RepID=UPI0008193359|nr:uncharacterized protein LOC108481531 [Gossypium arboreum]
MNFQAGSGSNPANNSNYPLVPNLDKVTEEENARIESQKQLEEWCKWLEEIFRVMEITYSHHGIDTKDLSLVPDLVLSPKFKMPEFEKYNGTSCPEAHITLFCRRMTGYVNNNQLLIHCFQDSLVGATSKWYNQLSRTRISSLKYLAQAFMKQYSHVTDMTPDRITLQNMEKKSNENFRQYGQRWREVTIQVQLPLLEKETTMLFINNLKAPFITHAGKRHKKLLRHGNDWINDRECNKKRKDRGKGKYQKPRAVTTGSQGSLRQESGTKQNTEKLQFTPIPMSYRELYQSLFNAHVVATFYLKPLQPPYRKWYDANAQYDYHSVVERLIKVGIVKFDNAPSAENQLPNHTDGEVNSISENMGRKIKAEITEVKTPLKWVWKKMVKRGLVISDPERSGRGIESYCEFHHEEGHGIQECEEFRALIQGLMDNNEIEFYEDAKEEGCICTSESTSKGPKVSYPVVIISRPKNKVGIQMAPKVIIQKPVVFSYKDNKRVPWNYDCNVTIPGKESSAKEDQDIGSHTRSGRRYDLVNAQTEPVKGKAPIVEQKKGKAAESE